MKKINKIKMILGVFAFVGLVSCEETPIYEELSTATDNVQLFISKAERIQTLTTFSLEEMTVTKNDTVAFNVGYGGLSLPANPIDINLTINDEVIDSLNISRQLSGEKEYIPFPTNAYDLSASSVSIAKGEMYSNFAYLNYYPEEFDVDKNYLLAVEMETPSDFALNPDRSIILFEVQEVIIPDPEPQYYEKDTWKVIDFNSEEDEGEGANGLASLIIDGDINTYWHSCWLGCSPEESSYPYYITVDMTVESPINGIEFAQRQSGTRGANLIEIEVSNDNSEWTNLGEFNLPNTIAPYLLEFEEKQTFRYFRTTIKSGHDDGGSGAVALGEVSPYILE